MNAAAISGILVVLIVALIIWLVVRARKRK